VRGEMDDVGLSGARLQPFDCRLALHELIAWEQPRYGRGLGQGAR
jgi:hypothetical protein